MKLVSAIIVLALGSVGFAETTKTSVKTAKMSDSTTMNQSTVTTTWNHSEAAVEPAKVHFMTNLVGLFESKANVQVNFFGMPQLALSVAFQNSADKTSPIKKTTSTTDISVTKTQYGVGAAYYVFPTIEKINFMLNPYLLTEKRSDVLDVENNLGFGMNAMAMYRVKNFSVNVGGQMTLVSGDNLGAVNAGVGYIF